MARLQNDVSTLKKMYYAGEITLDEIAHAINSLYLSYKGDGLQANRYWQAMEEQGIRRLDSFLYEALIRVYKVFNIK